MRYFTSRRLSAVLAISTSWVLLARPAAAQDDLERARLFYNSGNFDAALASAAAGRRKPATASSAALIIARARLERFRQTADPQDLNGARAELLALTPQDLSRQETMEWQIGVGEALFLENHAGAAAEWFKPLIASARMQLTSIEVEKLLEWWASATSQFAEGLSGNARTEKYREIVQAMEPELEREPASRAANYWIVVGARGAGDLNRAWNAAAAGWIRAKEANGSQQLRADLEQLVQQTIIPERAQMRTGQRLDARATLAEIAAMKEEWGDLTRRWSGPD
jgi:hypothetical protein